MALDIILNDPERYVLSEDERASYEKLAVFFGVAATDPSRFPPTGDSARMVKKLMRRAKGPAQPQSRRNKRKARQERRMRTAKARRKYKREDAENYNRAREAMEAELREMEQIHAEIEAQHAGEAQFMVIGPDGQTPLLMGVPESAIRPMEGAEGAPTGPVENEPMEARPSKVILPGTAEALGIEAL